MTKTLPITQAREELTDLVRNASKYLDEYAVIISAEEYESWKETIEILSDPSLVKAIRQGEKEIDEGKGIPWEEFKKQL